MKRILLVLLALCVLGSLSACWETYFDDEEELKSRFLDNRERFLEVALEALTYGDSTFISTVDFFAPEGMPEGLTGLYVNDTQTGQTRALDSVHILRFFADCEVNSLAVQVDREANLSACEFSMGGSGAYYNGIYYVEQDRPLFLNDFSIPLEADQEGFSYIVKGMSYYTEKCADQFYYYAAKVS